MVVSSIGKPDNDDNVNMLDGSDVTASEVLIWLPEVNYTVGRVKKSVYEQDCIPLWATVSICGNRPTMEDAFTALPHFLKIPIKMLMEDHEEMSPKVSHTSLVISLVSMMAMGALRSALFATLYCFSKSVKPHF